MLHKVEHAQPPKTRTLKRNMVLGSTPFLLSLLVSSAAATTTIRYDGSSPGIVASGGGRTRDAVAADVNGDDRTDVVLALGGNLVAALQGDNMLFTQETVLGPPTALFSSNVVLSVAAGDLDGDGQVDLVAGLTPRQGNDAALYAFLTQESATPLNYTEETVVPLGDNTVLGGVVSTTPGCYSVEVADMNGDGYLDIVASCINDNQRSDGVLAVFWNSDGTGRNWVSTIVSNRATFDPLYVARLKAADAFPAIFLISRVQNYVLAYESSAVADQQATGDNNEVVSIPSFTEVVIDATADAPRGITVGDWDKDGDMDVVTVTEELVVTYTQTVDAAGDAQFVKSTLLDTHGGLTQRYEHVSLVDVTGDGLVDVVYSGNVQGILFQPQIAATTTDGAAEFASDFVGLTENGSLNNFHLFADLNDDGYLDLVAEITGGGAPARLAYVVAQVEQQVAEPTAAPNTMENSGGASAPSSGMVATNDEEAPSPSPVMTIDEDDMMNTGGGGGGGTPTTTAGADDPMATSGAATRRLPTNYVVSVLIILGGTMVSSLVW